VVVLGGEEAVDALPNKDANGSVVSPSKLTSLFGLFDLTGPLPLLLLLLPHKRSSAKEEGTFAEGTDDDAVVEELKPNRSSSKSFFVVGSPAKI